MQEVSFGIQRSSEMLLVMMLAICFGEQAHFFNT